ncbi:MAG: TIGR03621 family F420-dependent LLM class oxidoreductase [Actinomycetota bacterium]|nr:TIGR03621 family F420-dependent LLM class oxidoreductase [Acidimicrobiia bacterium]MDQ3468706.1 TIGR03621 family F420-dependent LLM class oxidoreductase [Actinomycetota bacterium]
MTDPTTRPFRFGVQLTGPADATGWREQARRIESLGYASITMPDHFGDQLAPVPALAAAAEATTSVRIGALVFDNDYKHPVVLAKELATMDVLSDGRLEIGVGAGWMETDYRASGIPYDRPGVRIDRFVEGIAVIKGAMADGPFSFSGEHYTITDYDGQPSPVQRPHPPILVGGGGPRVLAVAAREADIVGINGTLTAGVIGPEAISTMTHDAVDQRIAHVREVAGQRIADIELNIRAFFVNVTDDRAGTISGVAGVLGVEEAMVADSPFALIGSPAAIVEDLQRRRQELGFSYVIVGADDVEPFAPVVAQLAGT